MTRPELVQMIADLRAAIYSGVKVVWTRTNGVEKRVEYQSTASMQQALASAEAQLAAMDGNGTLPTAHFAGFSSGYRGGY